MAWTERYVTVAGAGSHNGTSEANAWTFAEAIAGASSGHRVNVKVGTHAQGANSRNMSTANTWWRGYNSSIGDCDDDPTLSRPEVTFTGDEFLTISGTSRWSSVSVSGARRFDGNVVISAAYCVLHRVRSVNTGSGFGAAYAFEISGDGVLLSNCYGEAPSDSPVVYTDHSATLVDCHFKGGERGWQIDSAGFDVIATAIRCIWEGMASHGINPTATGTGLVADGCSFYSVGGDAIRLGASSTRVVASVRNCIFSAITGYGVNDTTSGGVRVFLASNLFHSCTAGNTNGLADYAAMDSQTDAGSPYTAAGSGDFTLAATSNARANGSPGLFE